MGRVDKREEGVVWVVGWKKGQARRKKKGTSEEGSGLNVWMTEGGVICVVLETEVLSCLDHNETRNCTRDRS
jgi:hypothetical protein